MINGIIKRQGQSEHHGRPGGSARLSSGPILTVNPGAIAVLTGEFAARGGP